MRLEDCAGAHCRILYHKSNENPTLKNHKQSLSNTNLFVLASSALLGDLCGGYPLSLASRLLELVPLLGSKLRVQAWYADRYAARLGRFAHMR